MKFLSALLLCLGMSFSLKAVDYYVSPLGSDAGEGSQAMPWKTIQYAFENATPGSTVYIMAGTYNEVIYAEVSGTAMNVITFKPFEMDEVIIDGTGLPDGSTLLNIENQSYLRIEGLHFTGVQGEFASAVYIQGTSSHIEIVNNVIEGIEGESTNGIVVNDASDVTITNNNISDMNAGDYPAAVYVLGTASNVIISDNDIAGIVGNYAAGIYVSGAVANIQILNNDISGVNFSNDMMVEVTGQTNANPLVVYGDAAFGLDMDNNPTVAPAPITGVSIIGNHVHNCRTGYSEGVAVTGNVDGFTIHGNYVFQISNIGIDVSGGFGYSPDPLQDFARNGTITANSVYQCRSEANIIGAGIYVDGARTVLVEHNRVNDCDRGYEIGCEVPDWVTSDIILRNNLAWHNDHAGIAIGGYNYLEMPAEPMDPVSGKVVSCQVLNNTCYDNSQFIGGEGELVVSYTEDCIIKNNIFYSKTLLGKIIAVELNGDGNESVNLVMDYNLFYHQYDIAPITVEAFIEWYDNPVLIVDIFDDTDQNENSVFADPRFVDVTIADFHLGSHSPAFDAGDPAYMPMMNEVVDIDGENRVKFDFVDIGADEAAVNLPVEYTRPLSAQTVQSGIQLRWSTGIEHNAAQFEVQRSADGSVFEKITAVPVKGNNSEYQLVDQHPNEGANYYRLKQIDLDGRFKLSNVAMAKWEAGAVIGVFPNPTSGHFNIRNSTGSWEKAVLINATGQTVRTFRTGEETTLQGLENGVYRLEVFETENAAPQTHVIVRGGVK